MIYVYNFRLAQLPDLSLNKKQCFKINLHTHTGFLFLRVDIGRHVTSPG